MEPMTTLTTWNDEAIPADSLPVARERTYEEPIAGWYVTRIPGCATPPEFCPGVGSVSRVPAMAWRSDGALVEATGEIVIQLSLARSTWKWQGSVSESERRRTLMRYRIQWFNPHRSRIACGVVDQAGKRTWMPKPWADG
jgi:hypothetical protein